MMRRLALLLAALALLLPAAAADEVARVGFLNSASPGPFQPLLAAFRQGLAAQGFVAGETAVIEERWAEGDYARLPALASELVGLPVDVLVATGGAPAARAARAATGTTPMVFIVGSDPVALGLVESLHKPGGPATGIQMFITGLDPKRLEILREVVPSARRVAVLLNPANPDAAAQRRDVESLAASIGLTVDVHEASTADAIDAAFDRIAQSAPDALLVGGDPFFNSRRNDVVAHAGRLGLPAIYELREFAAAGGLMSYGTDLVAAYTEAGTIAGRLLRGEAAAGIPVVQSTRFQFVLNLATARSLGIDIPPAVLARADEVIE